MTRHDRTGMSDHEPCELMPGVGGGVRCGAVQARGEVGGSETVAGGGRIHDLRDGFGLDGLVAALAEEAAGRAIEPQHDFGVGGVG